MTLRSRYRFNVLALLLPAIPFFGCAVGPDYAKPDVQVPDAWSEAISAQAALGPDASLQTWWTVFDDPVLTELIERARTSNLDLEVAMSRVRAARLQLGIARGGFLPVINAGAGASRTQISDNGHLMQVAPPGGFEPQSIFNIGIDAAWEIDVFGRVRRSVEAAGAQFEASVEDSQDVQVTLFAEVALSYIDVRAYQQRILNARYNAEAQRQSVQLTQDRYDSGVSSKLDVVQANSNLATTEAVIPSLEIGLHMALNRLAVLLGQGAGTLQRDLSAARPIPSPTYHVGAGVPAELLRQRPDIRSAERRLAARTAMIGVATADLYPRFALSGVFGFSAKDTNKLFDSSSDIWQLSAPIEWNLFSGGRVRKNIEVQEELANQALLFYKNTVLLALEEVENSIVSFSRNQVRRAHLADAVAATMEAVELANVQYDTGVTNFNNVLDMQRDLFEQQDQLVSTEADVMLNLIALYKALGGGWNINQAR
jgi:NodT family efflux transporter outer membrane factor (OMF) lipoprotein